MLSRRRKPKSDKGANPPRKSGPPNSLFGEILDWMLAPLLFLWPISIIVTHNVADNIANQPYDLALADSVRALARLVSRATQVMLERVERGDAHLKWLDADTAVPTRRLAAVGIWLFAAAMAYPYLPGSGSAAFHAKPRSFRSSVTCGSQP